MNRDQPLCGCIDFSPDANVSETAQRIIRRVRPALIFLHDRNTIRLPAIRSHPRGIIDGEFEIVGKLRARSPLGRIFVIKRSPFSREVDLRKGRRSREREHREKNDDPTAFDRVHSDAEYTKLSPLVCSRAASGPRSGLQNVAFNFAMQYRHPLIRLQR
ncbi:MAG: hypothetical protein DMG14_16760 [Acidobacteria bacterium]|nr:MAG: hypothetical protein DMG14_16760 [Acidobacteriota bacterium]